MTRRSISLPDVTLALEAAVALEFEIDPAQLRRMADQVDAVCPAIADDLRAKAARAVSVQAVMAVALARNPSPDA